MLTGPKIGNFNRTQHSRNTQTQVIVKEEVAG
jgi:hypothetical protein